MVKGAAPGPLRVRLLQAQLEAHHEVHPPLLVGTDGVHDRRHHVFVQAVGSENVGDLGGFLFRHLFGLTLFPRPLRGEVFGVGSSPPGSRPGPSQSPRRRPRPAPP